MFEGGGGGDKQAVEIRKGFEFEFEFETERNGTYRLLLQRTVAMTWREYMKRMWYVRLCVCSDGMPSGIWCSDQNGRERWIWEESTGVAGFGRWTSRQVQRYYVGNVNGRRWNDRQHTRCESKLNKMSTDNTRRKWELRRGGKRERETDKDWERYSSRQGDRQTGGTGRQDRAGEFEKKWM